jgi:hypothetical protein
MASDSGVRCEEESGKHDRRSHTEEFFTRYREDHAAHGEDERKSVDVILGDEDATMEVIDGEPDDTAGGTEDLSGSKLSSDEEEDASCVAVAGNPPSSCHDDSVAPMLIFSESRHRDGSIFQQDSSIWKKKTLPYRRP